jgi:hypothetical protein
VAGQSPNIFRIEVYGIGYLAAMAAALTLEIYLGLDAKIIVGI